ncbi:unnamed protein product [Aspergillus oryzae]|uniref:Unnamed protein product n=1 Tax=Aspergillus oryzae TaxID=5062 RepID=A0AAN4YNP1_ASPOZ|nr:unnamed protein product [Aspergillus oryzae]GMF83264.1 unnamed protein product [Aspergillus oryzae]GMG02109.1 unnamed protein product [Aspergillus oryzae]GMG31635.1 unnamed protein product [Aspergillus oryzae]
MEPQLQTPHLLSLVEEIKDAALKECSSSRSATSHYRFLGLIDQLKYTVETPTETVLRLIYQHHYLMPKEYTRSPMRWAVGQSQFEWLAQRKHHQALFNSYMSSRRQGKPSWFDVYPVERLTHGALEHDDAVFLVDVGGNQGHDLIRFREKFPDVTGRLVLQDLPKVIASAPAGEQVEAMAAYYFRAIFHDWPDYICHKILVNTISAMNAEYSRILIADFVLPDTGAALLQASIDIQMMSIGSGMERSERQWRELLGAAGLEITGIWSGSPGMESIIEAIPKPDRVIMKLSANYNPKPSLSINKNSKNNLPQSMTNTSVPSPLHVFPSPQQCNSQHEPTKSTHHINPQTRTKRLSQFHSPTFPK